MSEEISQKKWVCMYIYADSFKELNKFNNELINSIKRLKNRKHLELYFFNRYTNSEKDEYYIKFGFVNGDEKTESAIDDLLKKHKLRKTPYECEMWEVGGIPIDYIKCVSCEIFEKIRELLEGKTPTIEQFFYLLHFLMNQIGLGYENELRLYKSLEQSIEEQLKKSQS